MTHHDALLQTLKMLRNLRGWLDKAEAHAKAKSFDVNVLADARLAPDQYSLAGQIQATCDQAKYLAGYLSGKKAPTHPDTEKTVAELRARIQACLGFVETMQDSDFAGSAERKVSPPWLSGKWFKGEDYLVELALPNFYFHASMVYAILRHNGVDLGKMDYIGSITIQDE